MKTQRIKSVELWRLLFTVLVVLWHVKALPWCTEETRLLRSGHSVDFFFLLSGWLMAARGMKQPPDGPVGAGTWRFLRDKLRSIYPTYIFALLFDIAARALLTVRHRVTWSAAAGYIWDLLFLRAAGLGRASGDTAVGAAWYLSAMLLGMLLLYPLLLRFRDRFLRLMAPAAAILLYGWFFAAHGHLYFTLNFENGICLGLLRGIAGLCLGCVCYMLDRVLKEALPRPGRALRLLATGAEVLPVLAVICLSRLFEPSRADFLCVLLEGVTLTAAFSGMSFLTELTAKLRTDWIGPFTLALYLNHVVWLRILSDWNPPVPLGVLVVLYLALSLLTALLCLATTKLAAGLLRAARRKTGEARPSLKGTAIRCAAVWMLCAAAALGAWLWSGRLEVTPETPRITGIERSGGEVVLTWTPVEYATSYRVFRREPGGDWSLLRAVGTEDLTFADADPGENREYAVRACHLGRGDAVLSGYSAAASPKE